jgi:hypothetical protein
LCTTSHQTDAVRNSRQHPVADRLQGWHWPPASSGPLQALGGVGRELERRRDVLLRPPAARNASTTPANPPTRLRWRYFLWPVVSANRPWIEVVVCSVNGVADHGGSGPVMRARMVRIPLS